MEQKKMSRKRTILLADNKPAFLTTTALFLKKNDYEVITASSSAEARSVLLHKRIHLAILDIRLEDDDDDHDISGLLLAQDRLFRKVPKLILTGFPSAGTTRRALKVQPDGLPLAWDHISKEDDPDEMIKIVDQTFKTHIKINWNLSTHFDKRNIISYSNIVTLFDNPKENIDITPLVFDLEDLFCKLFYDYDQITL